MSNIHYAAEIQQRELPLLAILMAQQAVLLPLFFFVPNWIMLLDVAVVVVCIRRIRQPHYVLPQWLKVTLTLVAVAGVFWAFRKLSGRDAGVALITVMYCLKIIEVYRRRDAYVMLLLGFFMLVAAFLFTQKLWLSLYQFVPVMLILYALLSMHRLNTTNATRINGFARLLKSVGGYLLLALPIMIILFVFFPRLDGPIWRMPGAGQSASGISDTMTPGDVSSLQLFDKVAFRVRFVNEAPPPQKMYWRAFVLDKFDGLTWSRQKKLPRMPDSISTNQQSPVYQYEMVLEQNQQNWLITLDRPLEVMGRAQILADSAVYSSYRLRSRTRFSAVSQPDLVLDKTLSPSSRALNLSLPDDGDPKARLYAQELKNRFGSAKEIVNELLREIHQAPFYYTLNPPILQRDTIDDFWFEQRRGFCEHYASAFVFLARAAGIPARVVVGYQGAEKNPLADYYIVRYANAHAWTEVWFEGEGWVRIDPTAAIALSRIEDELLVDYRQREGLFDDFFANAMDLDKLSVYQQFMYWLDDVNADWNEWIMDFDRGSQQNLFKSFGFENIGARSQVLLMIGLIAAFTLVISFRWLRHRVPVPESEKLFSQFCQLVAKALVEQGYYPDQQQAIKALQARGPQAIVNLLGSSEVVQKKQFIRWIQAYMRATYAQPKVTGEALQDFRQRLKVLTMHRL